MGPAGLYKLPKRTFLDADGKPTTDEAKANELLGIAGDEIPMARALELGIANDDDADAAAAPSGHVLAERTYLDSEGKATTDEAEANSLLGNAGDTIPADVAVALGLAEEGDDAGAGEPSKDDVMAEHARELRKLKADDVRKLAESLEISTEGNADVVRGRLMEHYAAAYDAEQAQGQQGSADGGDPDVDDSGAQ